MKLDDLMDAFQYLDDDLIESADIIRRNPQPVKRKWSKYLATAACFGVLFLSIQGLFGPSGGAPDGMADKTDNAGNSMEDFASEMAQNIQMKDDADSSKEDLKGSMVTLPDYSSWKKIGSNQNEFSYYTFERGQTETETTTDDHSASGIFEGLICTSDVLAVYQNLEIPSSYLSVNQLESFEKRLSEITSFGVYGHYFYIDEADAVALLENGNYISFHEEEPDKDTEYLAKLVYLYDQESDFAIPYYHFYDMNIDKTDDESMIYMGWFVPAIEESYIENMPTK